MPILLRNQLECLFLDLILCSLQTPLPHLSASSVFPHFPLNLLRPDPYHQCCPRRAPEHLPLHSVQWSILFLFLDLSSVFTTLVVLS